jgi:hypothetical protein
MIPLGRRIPSGGEFPSGNCSRRESRPGKYQKMNLKPTRAVLGARMADGFK